MKILILLILLSSTLFSQKLWEIEVNPNDLLRDVTEIPNSDLLLFTYNTGKLEIRRSGDGSFVNQLIRKPNESGELRISNSGKVYYWLFNIDTIEFRDIATNEVLIKTSPEIEGLEGNPIFDIKKFQRIEIFENDTKIIGNMIYFDNNDARNNVHYFVIYNLITNEIEYQDDPYNEQYSVISGSYLSPDDNYYVEFSAVKSKVRLFNLETKQYEFNFDGSLSTEESYKVGSLERGKFQVNNTICTAIADEFRLYSFPKMNLLTNINVWSKSNFIISSLNGFNICNNTFVCDVAERKENKPTQYYRYFLKYNYETGEILYNSKNDQSSLDYSAVFTVDNCTKLIIDRDYDYRPGIIACYDYNTLNVESLPEQTNYFTKSNSTINFNAQEFVGQIANIGIYNSTGSRVGILHNGTINQENYNFQIPELPSGAYYLQCQIPNQNLHFNFMVVR